ncbi:unnamed protein product [Jaminaea pallidilutea]
MSNFYSLSDDEGEAGPSYAASSSRMSTTPPPRRGPSAPRGEHASYSMSTDDDNDDAMGLDERESLHSIAANGRPSRTNARQPPPSPFSRRRQQQQQQQQQQHRGLSPTPVPPLRTASPPAASTTHGSTTNSGPPLPLPAIERLQKVWVAERSAPELLPWSDSASRWKSDEIVDEVCAQMEQQVSILNLLSADEDTSEEEHLRLSLVQLDVERAKWLLRAYLRTRIHKIETHVQHYLSLPTRHKEMLLSPLEIAYADKYDTIRSNHFNSSVLDYLPEELRGLQDDVDASSRGLGGMVTRPNLDAPVFIRCVEDCGSLTMADDETAVLSKGSVHILSYGRVTRFIRQGRAELI